MIVTLLTKPDCEQCDRAKEILGRLATELAFTIETISLDTSNGQRLAQTAGVMFAPGILIDGRLATFGRPSERRLRRDIESATTSRAT